MVEDRHATKDSTSLLRVGFPVAVAPHGVPSCRGEVGQTMTAVL
jgi:hypothetical protein